MYNPILCNVKGSHWEKMLLFSFFSLLKKIAELGDFKMVAEEVEAIITSSQDQTGIQKIKVQSLQITNWRLAE